ncbi:uncharacterized protein LOC134069573 [Sardina pilchardus]|uniref:uncharacterized protein LOC134069573 n=1 Tax=Sardina pilchardus TaxID=27697 RepID=UPI002E128C13
MSKLKVSNTTVYTQGEEVRSGYLYKSPPPIPLISMKSQKSWKRRFFVLFKTSEGVYTLKYFRSEKKNKALGEIDLSEINTLLFCPESPSMWGCIHKMFRCPASCVLLLRTNSRDYFLVGENSWDTNGWFDALYNILQGQNQVRYQDVDVGKPRTCSAPPVPRTEQTHQASDREAKSKSMPLPPLSQPVNRPVCLLPPYPPNTQASLIEATGPSAAEEPIHAVSSSLPVKPAQQTYDKKVRPKSMPLPPPSLPRETNPARLYAVHENWPFKAPPQVPKSDENEEGADCGVYQDMATLCNVMKAEDKEPSEESMPLPPPSLPRDTNPTHFYAVQENWPFKAPPQIPKLDQTIKDALAEPDTLSDEEDFPASAPEQDNTQQNPIRIETSSHTKKRKTNTADNIEKQKLDILKDMATAIQKQDSDRTFGVQIAEELKLIKNPIIKTRLKRKLMNDIYEAQECDLMILL